MRGERHTFDGESRCEPKKRNLQRDWHKKQAALFQKGCAFHRFLILHMADREEKERKR